MYDVAAAAGLSVATVSRFLAGSGYVGQASRNKIADAIVALGYVPNRAAASLKSRRSGLLGFVVSDLQNPFVAELAASIGAQARLHGYGMVLSDSQGNPEHSVEAVELLRSHGVDGMIVTPPESPALNELLLSMQSLRIPLVGIGLHTSPPRIDVATVDTRAGAMAAVRHLIELGHRRIAMIGSRSPRRASCCATAAWTGPGECAGRRHCSPSTNRRPRSSPQTTRSPWVFCRRPDVRVSRSRPSCP
jgi:LacI family transcriptional regulator